MDEGILFVLSFGTFADTSRNGTFQFVRRPDTLVPIFKADSHTNAITYAKPTPRCPDTALKAVRKDRKYHQECFSHLDGT